MGSSFWQVLNERVREPDEAVDVRGDRGGEQQPVPPGLHMPCQ